MTFTVTSDDFKDSATLPDAQVYALTAYLLAEDAVIPKGTTLDAISLRAVKMPYVDRFLWSDEVGASR